MPFLRCFSYFFIIGELCPGLVLVSSAVAKCAYKQHGDPFRCGRLVYAVLVHYSAGMLPSRHLHEQYTQELLALYSRPYHSGDRVLL